MIQTTNSPPPWYVYIVQCRDNTYYTGITTNLSRRLQEHNSPKQGARYTRPRQPVKLVYHEPAHSRSGAASREYQIRKLTPTKKKALISTHPHFP
ncbi:MAG: GIY-YIG nuclease family protein [Desulfobulbaceae bacterium]|nr:GIY-YIG nuclease family protein [Desulfobulbaceae bacterium]